MPLHPRTGPGGFTVSSGQRVRRSRLNYFRLFFTQNKNAFPGRAPPEKASECLVRRRLCLRWARYCFAYPGVHP